MARAKTEKTPRTTSGPADITDDERALVERYCQTHNIKPGSLRYAGGREEWGNKRTVICLCKECGQERIVATSDLHWRTTAWCVPHSADIKRGRKTTKEAKRKLK